jgi:ribonuclease T1
MRRTLFGLFAALFLAAALPAAAQRGPAPEARGVQVPTVRFAELPPEAITTLRLIERKGPFPYAKDGAVFGNREGRLPKQRRGYYREYTVKTPGERTRGARRIVSGAGGERYYTADHYDTFRRIVE